MNQNKRAELKVGISVLLAIIISLFILAWAKNFTLFSQPKELTVRFDSVAGLSAGDPVSINGVKKGYVEKINIDKNSVLVNLFLDEDVQLNTDATFSIMMLDLMGGKKIEISPGDAPSSIDFSVIQEGSFSGDISTAMAMLSGMEENIKTIIEELSFTLNTMNKIIGDEEFNDNLKNSVSELSQLTVKVSSMIDENRAGIKSLIDSTSQFMSTSNKVVKENRENIKQTLAQSIELIENSNQFVGKLDALLQEIQSQENNAGKLLYDENFLIDLKESMQNVKHLTKLLVEQLEGEGINVDANIDLF
ncbi:MAG: MlaD family protein [Melioribacteraceae bacterium]|nr:MlaD family protein [Melioribacteraceae bacterium]